MSVLISDVIVTCRERITVVNGTKTECASQTLLQLIDLWERALLGFKFVTCL